MQQLCASTSTFLAVLINQHAPQPTNQLGHLATIRGTVVRMSHIRPLIVEMDFSCAKCCAAQHATFPDGRFAPPTRCVGE
jgi:DNA replicative helicase MCM subunit Mcm2 (Cdc46/Mcm family)